MTMSLEARPPRQYLEQRPAIVFPESADVPESRLHFDLRVLLYQLLCDALEPEATVGSDQFMYYDAEDPSAVVAPDGYVRLSPRTDSVKSWKVWERGAPEVAIEIVSDDDRPESAWQRKLIRYRHLGVQELVRFDPETPTRPLRLWDRVNGTLQERKVNSTRVPSLLGLNWVIAPADGFSPALRIERNQTLVPTRLEAHHTERAEREAERAEREAERAEREAERRAAEALIRELEAAIERQGK